MCNGLLMVILLTHSAGRKRTSGTSHLLIAGSCITKASAVSSLTDMLLLLLS